MIYIANPRGRARKKTKKSKTKRGSAGRRAKSSSKGRHGGTMAKRRKKRRAKSRRANPVRRKRRVRRRPKARRRKNPRRRRVARRRRRSTSRRRNPRRRRRRVKSRRRRNPVRRRRRVSRRRVGARRRRRNPSRKRRYGRKRRVTRRRRRNPTFKGILPSKAYFKTVLGDAAGITAGYLANSGISILLTGSATRTGVLTSTLNKITNPHLKFAVEQTINVLMAFVVGGLVKKFAPSKAGRLGENMAIGGLVRVIRLTIGHISVAAGFGLGTELLAGGGRGRLRGFMQAGNSDAIETGRMAGYLVEGGQMGTYERDYSYDYSMMG